MTLRAHRDCVVAVTGVGFVASTYVWTFPLWTSFYVRNGWTVHVAKSGDGNWAYLAAAGGIEVEPALGSRSTYTRAGLGKNLQVGDILRLGKPMQSLEDLAARILPASDATQLQPVANHRSHSRTAKRLVHTGWVGHVLWL